MTNDLSDLEGHYLRDDGLYQACPDGYCRICKDYDGEVKDNFAC